MLADVFAGARVYGYTSPKQLEPGVTRLRVCESEVSAYVRVHPQLTREEVLSVMMSAGPIRAKVESELQRIAEARRLPFKQGRAKA